MPPSTSLPTQEESYYDLGVFHRLVSTNNKECQLWFNRGLTWSYAFNHEESARCFENAITKDSSCAMAYWGLAYALGPNYNKPWEFFDDVDRETTVSRANAAAGQAKEKAEAGVEAEKATLVERALATAIQSRYPQQGPASDCSVWNAGYAAAMATVYEEFPDDLDVAALYADALMNLTPWGLWDLRTGEPAPGARTVEARGVLERGLGQDVAHGHPGLMHFYIHLMEMSGTPELALPAANHLRNLVPDAGHLNHMPTHLDVLCGDYRTAITSNQDAIRADRKYLARAGPMNFYTLYRCHDYHFAIYAAMFAGQMKTALDTVAELEASIPEELLRVKSPPMADWLEGFLSMRVHVLVRFGRWREILYLNLPRDAELYCVTTAMIHYARGVALAATGDIETASAERESFRDAIQHVSPSRTLFNNTCVDILAVAGAMLEGEVEYRHKRFDEAFNHLRHAISLADALPYDEPWGWMQPPRHAYGALLLEQNRVEEALSVYSADLGKDNTLPRALRHPKNAWALHGYRECLRKLGRQAEADVVEEEELMAAIAAADVPVESSCFCRLQK